MIEKELDPLVEAFARHMERRLHQPGPCEFSRVSVMALLHVAQAALQQFITNMHQTGPRAVIDLMADAALCCLYIAHREGNLNHETTTTLANSPDGNEYEPGARGL